MGPATETDKSMPAAGVAGERAASARKKEKGRNYLLAPHLVGLSSLTSGLWWAAFLSGLLLMHNTRLFSPVCGLTGNGWGRSIRP